MSLKTILWGISFLPLLVAVIAYAWLPSPVAMQWGADGHPTWFAPKATFVVEMLLLPALAWLFLASPVSGAALVKPSYIYLYAAIFVIVAVAFIGSTIANLLR